MTFKKDTTKFSITTSKDKNGLVTGDIDIDGSFNRIVEALVVFASHDELVRKIILTASLKIAAGGKGGQIISSTKGDK